MADTIRIGLMAPLTGLVDMYGPEIVRAARIACDEVNESGGLLGKRLEIIVEDDGSLPAAAVPAARRLLDEHGCSALIGNLLSNSRIAVVNQVAEPNRVPLLNFSFYEGSICSRYFFHFAALPNQQINKMIPFIARRFGPKMFFAGNNYEWPRGSIDAAIRVLRRLHGDVVGEAYLPLGASQSDIDRLLGEVARSGADVFVPYFAGADQVSLLTRFTEMGLKERMVVVMGHYDEMMVSCLPAYVSEGFYSSNTYFMSLDTPVNRRCLERLAATPGVNGLWPAGNGILTNFGEGAYVCVHAFAQAVAASGTVESEALVASLERVCVDAPQGRVEMDALTHHASVNTYLSQCNKDGTFAIVEAFGLNKPRIPERYRPEPDDTHGGETQDASGLDPRQEIEAAAVRSKLEAARQILSITDVAIIATTDKGVITEANRTASQMFGFGDDELKGVSVHLLLPPHFRERHAKLLKQFVEGEQTERRMASRSEVTGYRKDGSFFPVEASIAKFQGDDEPLVVVTLRDVTDRKKAEEALSWRATHDPLTQLPNRALIRERLANALHRSGRSGLSVALLFIDLDGFKAINDTHGHEAGDCVLKSVASRLLEQVRPGDTVARLAGDEFVILCDQVEQPGNMGRLAERINETLREPIEHGQEALFLTASIGVAIGNGRSHTADDMLRHADTAMYAVKEKGRDSWQFFNESLQQQATLRLNVSNGLRQAIRRNELSALYQPLVLADSGRIAGAELLLRWKPAEGEVSPAIFIPIAETTGSIVPIGAWVFREACMTEVAWRRQWGEQAPYVSVNLSARQINDGNLVAEFQSIIAETGAQPERLLLEITETALMADVEANLRVLRQLADKGLKIAVDDFGTGYSSLAQLTRLPVSVLKIDRAFVDGIDKSAENRAIVQAIAGLGRSLGLKLVAEGVETREQRQELESYGCDLLQGYHFSRPIDVQAFSKLFEQYASEGLKGASSSLFFVIYASSATMPMTPEEFEAFRKRVVANNRAQGVTGCLLYQDGHYLQMLEGREEVLAVLIERIRRDSRHRDVTVVMQGPIKHRVFRDWGMVFHGFQANQPELDFSPWQKRRITLLDLAEDARACYAYLTAHSGLAR